MTFWINKQTAGEPVADNQAMGGQERDGQRGDRAFHNQTANEQATGERMVNKQAFINKVWEQGKRLYRDLPWRYAAITASFAEEPTIHGARVATEIAHHAIASDTTKATYGMEMSRGVGTPCNVGASGNAKPCCGVEALGNIGASDDVGAPRNAYAILVSEVMLQQTQVSRVEKFWPLFLKQFPTLDALASAGNADVLEVWQGLGYNRRALALKRCAEICAEQYAGKIPVSEDDLLALPGIGKATAAGVRAFAYNLPGVYLETNVRTVFLHEFFSGEERVSDAQLEPYVRETCSKENPRGWYYALLDYGAYLKKTLPNPSRKSAHYAKQSAFEGSRRQKRAEIVRMVLDYPHATRTQLRAELNAFEHKHGRGDVPLTEFERIVTGLEREGFFAKRQP